MRDKDGNAIAVPRWRFPSRARFRRHYRWRYQVPLGILRRVMEWTPFLPWSPALKRRVAFLDATGERILALMEIYSPYTNLDCRFETGNTRRLLEAQDPEDRETFNFDVLRIDWQEYIQAIHLPGLIRHVL